MRRLRFAQAEAPSASGPPAWAEPSPRWPTTRPRSSGTRPGFATGHSSFTLVVDVERPRTGGSSACDSALGVAPRRRRALGTFSDASYRTSPIAEEPNGRNTLVSAPCRRDAGAVPRGAAGGRHHAEGGARDRVAAGEPAHFHATSSTPTSGSWRRACSAQLGPHRAQPVAAGVQDRRRGDSGSIGGSARGAGGPRCGSDTTGRRRHRFDDGRQWPRGDWRDAARGGGSAPGGQGVGSGAGCTGIQQAGPGRGANRERRRQLRGLRVDHRWMRQVQLRVVETAIGAGASACASSFRSGVHLTTLFA